MKENRNQKSIPGMVAVVMTIILLAQSAQAQWVRRYGLDGSDRVYACDLAPAGGYITTGRTTSFSEFSFEDAFLLRVEPDGDTTWWKIYGVDGRDERAYAIDVTADGGYIIAGFAEATDTNNADFYLVRTAADGSELWSKTYGGDGQDTAYSVIETADGGYLVAGYSTSFGEGGSNGWLLRTDSLGDTVWTRLYGSTTDDAIACIVPADHGYILVGWSGPEEGNRDLYLANIHEDGMLMWEKTYGGQFDDMAYSVEPTSDSCYIVIGNTWSQGAGENDIWLLKIDSAGDTLWTRTYGGYNNEEGFGVCQTTDGGYILTGSSRSFGLGEEDVWLIRTDEAGDTLWSRVFGGDKLDQCYDVHQVPDGGYFLAGRTRSFGSVRCDYYLIKTDEGGSIGVDEEVGGGDAGLAFSIRSTLFTDATAINYQLSSVSDVGISVYDALGRKVRTLRDARQDSGAYTVNWDGTNDDGGKLASGVYFAKFEAGSCIQTARLVILR